MNDTVYFIIESSNKKVSAFTKISKFDTDDQTITKYDILDTRIESAIDDGLLPNLSYNWIQETKTKPKNTNLIEF
ncbi:hypothetical protein [Faecalibacillus intestinalis]|uniref:hypothetical protein n=1 Tax=Faecalibacillus intestinalis TaxID=1982626 RepID=UPI0039931B6C